MKKISEIFYQILLILIFSEILVNEKDSNNINNNR